MTNIIDYVKWRGDLSFQNDPFNDIDALALSLLVYVDFAIISNKMIEFLVNENSCINFSTSFNLKN